MSTHDQIMNLEARMERPIIGQEQVVERLLSIGTGVTEESWMTRPLEFQPLGERGLLLVSRSPGGDRFC